MDELNDAAFARRLPKVLLHEHLDGNYTLSDHVYGGALDDS